MPKKQAATSPSRAEKEVKEEPAAADGDLKLPPLTFPTSLTAPAAPSAPKRPPPPRDDDLSSGESEIESDEEERLAKVCVVTVFPPVHATAPTMPPLPVILSIYLLTAL
jgi:hypothetical protein